MACLIASFLILLISLISIHCFSDRSNEPSSHKAARLLQPGVSNLLWQNSSSSPRSSAPKIASTTLLSPLGSFKAYFPSKFTLLRSRTGITDESFIKSLDPDNLVCLSSDSKSGAAFWRTKDGNLVLKTIKHYECKNLCSIMDNLVAHVTSGHSCIAAVIGLYRVKLKNGRKIYFMIAKNVYSGVGYYARKYDLKGSTVGRRMKLGSDVMKDLDLMDSDVRLNLGPHVRSIILNAIASDADFLRKHNFMDYSLLVTVEEKAVGTFRRFFHRMQMNPISTSLHDRYF